MRSTYCATSASCDPPNPRLTHGRLGNDSSSFHKRAEELPTNRLAPLGGGDCRSCSSKAEMALSHFPAGWSSATKWTGSATAMQADAIQTLVAVRYPAGFILRPLSCRRGSPTFCVLPVCDTTSHRRNPARSNLLRCLTFFHGGNRYTTLTGSHRAGRDAGWSSPVAREAHNLEVVGSNPAPAIPLWKTLGNKPLGNKGFFVSRRSVHVPARRFVRLPRRFSRRCCSRRQGGREGGVRAGNESLEPVAICCRFRLDQVPVGHCPSCGFS